MPQRNGELSYLVGMGARVNAYYCWCARNKMLFVTTNPRTKEKEFVRLICGPGVHTGGGLLPRLGRLLPQIHQHDIVALHPVEIGVGDKRRLLRFQARALGGRRAR